MAKLENACTNAWQREHFILNLLQDGQREHRWAGRKIKYSGDRCGRHCVLVELKKMASVIWETAIRNVTVRRNELANTQTTIQVIVVLPIPMN